MLNFISLLSSTLMDVIILTRQQLARQHRARRFNFSVGVSWTPVKGTFQVFVGASSRDIRLRTTATF